MRLPGLPAHELEFNELLDAIAPETQKEYNDERLFYAEKLNVKMCVWCGLNP